MRGESGNGGTRQQHSTLLVLGVGAASLGGNAPLLLPLLAPGVVTNPTAPPAPSMACLLKAGEPGTSKGEGSEEEALASLEPLPLVSRKRFLPANLW